MTILKQLLEEYFRAAPTIPPEVYLVARFPALAREIVRISNVLMFNFDMEADDGMTIVKDGDEYVVDSYLPGYKMPNEWERLSRVRLPACVFDDVRPELALRIVAARKEVKHFAHMKEEATKRLARAEEDLKASLADLAKLEAE